MNITSETMVFVPAIIAGIAVLVSIVTSIFNISAAKRANTKGDLIRIYDKLDCLQQEYRKEDKEIVKRVSNLEITVYGTQQQSVVNMNGIGQ